MAEQIMKQEQKKEPMEKSKEGNGHPNDLLSIAWGGCGYV